jgi:hypothetical protein
VAILIAAGPGERWGYHLGMPKHFVPVDGEPILQRAVRLIGRHCKDIWVVGVDDRYKIEGSQLFIPDLEPANFGADKFLSSRELWNTNGRTIVFFGDVYFTEEAMSTILSFDEREWTVFGRFGPSALTGTPWGELFAQSFWPEHIDEHLSALVRLARLCGEGTVKRGQGWEHYRLMNGATEDALHLHRELGHFVEIDDWTDDFDYPDDYDRFISNRRPV